MKWLKQLFSFFARKTDLEMSGRVSEAIEILQKTNGQLEDFFKNRENPPPSFLLNVLWAMDVLVNTGYTKNDIMQLLALK